MTQLELRAAILRHVQVEAMTVDELASHIGATRAEVRGQIAVLGCDDCPSRRRMLDCDVDGRFRLAPGVIG